MSAEFPQSIFPKEKREGLVPQDKILAHPQSLYTNQLIMELDGDSAMHFEDPSFTKMLEGTVRGSIHRGMRVLLSVDEHSRGYRDCEEVAKRLFHVGVVPHGQLGKDELPSYYDYLVRRYGMKYNHTTLMTTDIDLQLSSALSRGMGVLAGQTVSDVLHKVDSLVTKNEIVPFDPVNLVYNMYRQNETNIIAVMGHTGSGKTTLSRQIREQLHQEVPTDILHFDSYHQFSRKTRKAMLRQSELLSPEVRSQLEDHDNWYLFDWAEEDLIRLKNLQPIHRNNMYSQESGEMRGKINITPDPNGQLIIFEGVATHKFPSLTDRLMIVTTHPLTRLRNLRKRDSYPTEEERAERLRVTQQSEIKYIRRASKRADKIVYMTPDYRFYEVPEAGIL